MLTPKPALALMPSVHAPDPALALVLQQAALALEAMPWPMPKCLTPCAARLHPMHFYICIMQQALRLRPRAG